MGFFRKHKARDFTEDEAKAKLHQARQAVIDCIKEQKEGETLDEALQNWGEWRELLARKQGQNESEVRQFYCRDLLPVMTTRNRRSADHTKVDDPNR